MTSKEDPDDVSLLEGAGLFPPDEEYNTYVCETVAYSAEVSRYRPAFISVLLDLQKTTCSRFNAVEM